VGVSWAAREGIASIFLIFAVNSATFIASGKTLPLGIEAIGGIVSITVAAVGITTARGVFNDRAYWARTEVGQVTSYTPGTAPSTIPPAGG
jgi:hypothetical protein